METGADQGSAMVEEESGVNGEDVGMGVAPVMGDTEMGGESEEAAAPPVNPPAVPPEEELSEEW